MPTTRKKVAPEDMYVTPLTTADPLEIALLQHILGDNGDGDYRAILMTNAITGARAILAQTSDRILNDEGPSHETYFRALEGVKAWAAMDAEKREELNAIEALEEQTDEGMLAGESLSGTISDCVDSSLLLGAALMYELLQGGRR